AAGRSFMAGVAGRLYASHLPTLARYRQIVERRNHLLRQRLTSRLAPWDEQFATVGMELIDRRRRAVAVLQTELARVFSLLAGERQKVEIRYRTALGEATEPAALRQVLEGSNIQQMR